MWDVNKSDMIPFLATFIFTLRSSSTGLVVGIITHLILCLGKSMKPLQREKSKGRTIYLEGICYYPAGDELSAKFQRNAKRLEDGSRFTIDFKNVTTIDAGAAVGIVDGIQFSLDSNSTLIINLRDINVS